jgi:glutathione-regulated potassium-efflux system protein KefB
MAAEAGGVELEQAVALLAAGVAAVPLFRKAGLGSVLGYLTAGVVVGPFGLAVLPEPEAALHVAELGVVLFLFLIGLEMRPAKLWALRGAIFGLGAAQVLTCAGLLTGVGVIFGLPLAVAAIAAFGFVLSSTAVIMQMMDERGETATPNGQRSVSILLLEDLAIVPLLAVVALLGSFAGAAPDEGRPAWQSITVGLGAIAAVVAVGRWLLDPMFRLLAKSGAREVMTAAALLVVLGTALFMQWAGCPWRWAPSWRACCSRNPPSATSSRQTSSLPRHPARAVLPQRRHVARPRGGLAGLAARARRRLAFMVVKAAGIYGVARLFGADNREAVHRAATFAQAASSPSSSTARHSPPGCSMPPASATMTAIVILSMALTPLVVMATDRLMPREAILLDGVDQADGLHGRVLVIGFGRFAQVVSQPLLAHRIDVSLIETDVEMIQAAAAFGFKVYYGDGTRLDVLRASGAGEADAILVCVDKPDVADRIVDLCKAEFRWRSSTSGPSTAAMCCAWSGLGWITRSARPSNRPWPSAGQCWSASACQSRRLRRRWPMSAVATPHVSTCRSPAASRRAKRSSAATWSRRSRRLSPHLGVAAAP